MSLFDKFLGKKDAAKGAKSSSQTDEKKSTPQHQHQRNAQGQIAIQPRAVAEEPLKVTVVPPISTLSTEHVQEAQSGAGLSDDEWQQITGGSFFVGKEGMRFVRLDGLEELREFAEKKGMQEAKDLAQIALLAKQIKQGESIKRAGFTFRMGGIEGAQKTTQRRTNTPAKNEQGVEELVFPDLSGGGFLLPEENSADTSGKSAGSDDKKRES